MADISLTAVVRHLRDLAGGSLSDGQLLRQLAVQRDEQAFAALVQRHAPLVWRVGRQTLPHAQPAAAAAGTARPRRRATAGPRGRATAGSGIDQRGGSCEDASTAIFAAGLSGNASRRTTTSPPRPLSGSHIYKGPRLATSGLGHCW